ncbi:MAG: PhoH family protein, partial [Elusimicrobiaceae bacterium]|nr:PhoH family protein [Elusimicrobiaceae bacterium]
MTKMNKLAAAIFIVALGVNVNGKVLESSVATVNGKPIKPKTIGQKNYIDAIRNNLIVFANGPAGTGKTYLAMAMAVSLLVAGKYNRIVLTRPAVEAGENLGFL